VPICHIFFHQVAGQITEYASDKYQHNHDIQPSLLFRELCPEGDTGQQLELTFGAEGRRGQPRLVAGERVVR
jgi:dCTP deaminase